MRFLWCFALFFLLMACSMPARGGYDRASGSYVSAKKSKTASVEKKASSSRVSESKSESSNKGAEQKKKNVSAGAYEEAAKPWIGTPYLYGGSSKSGTDCSGFVLQIYKEVRGMSLPHKASKMYDMGKSVSRDDLKEGDLVFFGSFWDIDHVGIYLSGDRFVHASSSKGVMISPMDNVYWKKRYQGARRY